MVSTSRANSQTTSLRAPVPGTSRTETLLKAPSNRSLRRRAKTSLLPKKKLMKMATPSRRRLSSTSSGTPQPELLPQLIKLTALNSEYD